MAGRPRGRPVRGRRPARGAEGESEESTERREFARKKDDREQALAAWVPKTGLGKKVQAGEITSMDEIFAKNLPILEPEIVDSLLELEEKMVDFKKTTRVTMAGRKFSFRAAVLVGNRNGYVGLGIAKDTEKYPALRKAKRHAKLNLVKVRRGCGSWECTCGLAHSVPFKVNGKCSSVKIALLPAPKGTGLVAGQNIKDVFEFAGITDVWSNTSGSTDTKLNFVSAAIDALGKTTKMKVSNEIAKKEEKKS
ncbi:MAG: 30S ribosomal protein S5 [Candidatus ainarchaeum sp.]|nr:30S ribosomal protein S5 [Candidatus ainarchaeum sp.]